jgi:isocitrate dehydrogenase
VHEIDSRGSHFYLALYWAQEMATQRDDTALGAEFEALAEELQANEATIARELLAAQGSPVDLGGYYFPDPERAERAMRPSATLNRALAAFLH